MSRLPSDSRGFLHPNSHKNDHFNLVMKLIRRYLRGNIDVRLMFDKTGELDECVVGFVDSNYVGDHYKRRSLTDYVFTLINCILN